MAEAYKGLTDNQKSIRQFLTGVGHRREDFVYQDGTRATAILARNYDDQIIFIMPQSLRYLSDDEPILRLAPGQKVRS